ncbi:MAG: hypothetical protein WED09_06465 [Homoserinimonas sp.]
MRPVIDVPGSAIDRVFHPPVVPVRRFRRAIDNVLTLALGPICAFALTLGPAPLNTFTASSATATTFGERFEPSPEAQLVPAQVDSDTSVENQQELRRSMPSPRAKSSGRPAVPPAAPGEHAEPPVAAKHLPSAQPLKPGTPSTPTLSDLVLPSSSCWPPAPP